MALNWVAYYGNIGVSIRYRTDGKLFNLRELQVKSKVHEYMARDLLFRRRLRIVCCYRV